MKTILAPIDFSDVSPKTAVTACSLISDIQVDLVFLHVLPAKTPCGALGSGTATRSDLSQVLERRAADKLRDLVRRARIQGIMASYLITFGSPATEILKSAKQVHADLIVMGSHDYNSLEGSVVGSTTKTVLYSSPCPIVIVPSDHTPPNQQVTTSVA